jgi:hypothetical protein
LPDSPTLFEVEDSECRSGSEPPVNFDCEESHHFADSPGDKFADAMTCDAGQAG